MIDHLTRNVYILHWNTKSGQKNEFS